MATRQHKDLTGTDLHQSKAAGSSGQVQFNSSGVLGGDSNLTWDNTAKVFSLKKLSGSVALDVTGLYAKATTNPLDYIGQFASTDTSNPLTLRLGIKTDSTASNRYGAIEVDDAGTKRSLVLQPFGGNVGIGVTVPNSPLQVSGPISTALTIKTSTYTVTASDSVVVGNPSSGSITFNLPSASGITGRRYSFKRISASQNVVIDGADSETIDGATTKTLASQYAGITIVSDGTNWIIESQMGTIT